MYLQLQHVRDIVGFDALVVADELGFPIVETGDPQLVSVLADSAMWHDFSDYGVDPFTMDALRDQRPELGVADVFVQRLRVQETGREIRFMGVGRSVASFAGFEHAAKGLERIFVTCEDVAA